MFFFLMLFLNDNIAVGKDDLQNFQDCVIIQYLQIEQIGGGERVNRCKIIIRGRQKCGVSEMKRTQPKRMFCCQVQSRDLSQGL